MTSTFSSVVVVGFVVGKKNMFGHRMENGCRCRKLRLKWRQSINVISDTLNFASFKFDERADSCISVTKHQQLRWIVVAMCGVWLVCVSVCVRECPGTCYEESSEGTLTCMRHCYRIYVMQYGWSDECLRAMWCHPMTRFCVICASSAFCKCHRNKECKAANNAIQCSCVKSHYSSISNQTTREQRVNANV